MYYFEKCVTLKKMVVTDYVIKEKDTYKIHIILSSAFVLSCFFSCKVLISREKLLSDMESHSSHEEAMCPLHLLPSKNMRL